MTDAVIVNVFLWIYWRCQRQQGFMHTTGDPVQALFYCSRMSQGAPQRLLIITKGLVDAVGRLRSGALRNLRQEGARPGLERGQHPANIRVLRLLTSGPKALGCGDVVSVSWDELVRCDSRVRFSGRSRVVPG